MEAVRSAVQSRGLGGLGIRADRHVPQLAERSGASHLIAPDPSSARGPILLSALARVSAASGNSMSMWRAGLGRGSRPANRGWRGRRYEARATEASLTLLVASRTDWVAVAILLMLSVMP